MNTIEIRSFDGETLRADAIATNTPGLAVTRAVFREPGYAYWNVTHIATGKRIPGFFEISEKAVKFADDLASLGDWTTPDGPERTPTFGRAYLNLMNTHWALDECDLWVNEPTAA